MAFGCAPSNHDKRDYVAMYVYTKGSKEPWFFHKVLKNNSFEARLLKEKYINTLQLDSDKCVSIWNNAKEVKDKVIPGEYSFADESVYYCIIINVDGATLKYYLGRQSTYVSKPPIELSSLWGRLSGLTKW